MKNDYCPLTRQEVESLNIPTDLKGLLLSPFQHNRRDGFVIVPEDAFRDFVACTTEHLKVVSEKITHHCYVSHLTPMKPVTEYPIELRRAEREYDYAVRALRRANSLAEFRQAEADVIAAKKKMGGIAEAVAHGHPVLNTSQAEEGELAKLRAENSRLRDGIKDVTAHPDFTTPQTMLHRLDSLLANKANQ